MDKLVSAIFHEYQQEEEAIQWKNYHFEIRTQLDKREVTEACMEDWSVKNIDYGLNFEFKLMQIPMLASSWIRSTAWSSVWFHKRKKATSNTTEWASSRTISQYVHSHRNRPRKTSIDLTLCDRLNLVELFARNLCSKDKVHTITSDSRSSSTNSDVEFNASPNCTELQLYWQQCACPSTHSPHIHIVHENHNASRSHNCICICSLWLFY